jgi:hypothetical protein
MTITTPTTSFRVHDCTSVYVFTTPRTTPVTVIQTIYAYIPIRIFKTHKVLNKKQIATIIALTTVVPTAGITYEYTTNLCGILHIVVFLAKSTLLHLVDSKIKCRYTHNTPPIDLHSVIPAHCRKKKPR